MSAQGSIIRYITVMVIVGLAVLTAATFHSARKEIGQALPGDAMAAAYFERHSEPDCRFKGAWHDWERDEWMTLSCLEVKVQHREGSYSSATGPRATLQVSMQAPTGLTEQALSTSLARTVKGKITISACRSRSKMPSTPRRYVSWRPPTGLHALRSSFGRRMNKFFTTALNTVSIVPPSQTKLSEDRLPAVPEVDA
jgi:hypothetical protein